MPEAGRLKEALAAELPISFFLMSLWHSHRLIIHGARVLIMEIFALRQ
jgi:hypothetical protein